MITFEIYDDLLKENFKGTVKQILKPFLFAVFVVYPIYTELREPSSVYNKNSKKVIAFVILSVGDPDPQVFGPPGSFPFLIIVLSGTQ